MTCGLMAAAGGGCKPLTPGQEQGQRLAARLDDTAKILEEYGSVTMSSPLLVPLDDAKTESPFAFKLTANADEFYKDAKSDVEGAAAQLSERQIAGSLDVQGKLDVTALNAGRLADTAQAAQIAAAQQQRDATVAAIDTTDPAKRAAAIAAADQTFADRLTKLAAPPTDTPTTTTPTPIPNAPAPTTPVIAGPPAPTATTPPTPATPTPATPAAAPPAAASDAPAKADPAAKPAAPATDLVPAKADALTGPFVGIGKLLGDVKPTLRDRTAINIAAGDTATRGLFAVLGDPSKYTAMADKKLMFGVTMINVEPGWRTQANFLAEVSVSATYEYLPARRAVIAEAYKHPEKYAVDTPAMRTLIGRAWIDTTNDSDLSDFPFEAEKFTTSQLKDLLGLPSCSDGTDALRKMTGPLLNSSRNLNASAGEGSIGVPGGEIPAEIDADNSAVQPLVAAVSPMTDVQTLDLTDSTRQRTELALQIAAQLQAAGADAAAKAFFSYANQLQTDVTTRSALPVVTAFSNSGGVFGFRIGPQLQGLDTTSILGGESKPTNRLERQSFPALVLLAADSADVKLRFRSRFGKIEAVEPVLRFTQSQRWSPLVHHWYWWNHRLSETDHAALLINDASATAQVPLTVEQKQQKTFELIALQQVFDPCASSSRAEDRKYFNKLLYLLSDALDHPEAAPGISHERIDSLRDGLMSVQAMAGDEPQTVVCVPPQCRGEAYAVVSDMLAALKKQPTLSDFEAATLRQRERMLQLQAIGSSNEQYLPLAYFDAVEKSKPEAKPGVTAVTPAVLTIDPKHPDADLFFTVAGQDLDKVNGKAGAGTVKIIAKSKTLVAVKYTPPCGCGDPQADLIGFRSDDELLATVAVVVKPHDPRKDKNVEASATDRDKDGKVTRQTFTAPVDHADLIPRLIDARKPASRPAVEVNVNTKP